MDAKDIKKPNDEGQKISFFEKLVKPWKEAKPAVKIVSIVFAVFLFIILAKAIFPSHTYRMYAEMGKSDYESKKKHSFATNDEYASAEGVGEAEDAPGIDTKSDYRSNEVAALKSAVPATPKEKFNQMVIKTCSISVEVKEYNAASKEIEKIMKESGGYIENSSISTSSDNRKSGQIVLKIPAANFETALEKMEKVGKILGKSIRGENVTEEYYDIESRLKNAETTQQRILTFLEKAKNAREAVEVQHELDAVSEKIERFKGRLKFLSHSVGFSTITMNVGEPTTITVQQSGLSGYIKGLFQDILNSCLDTFASVVKAILVLISFLLPIAVICGIIALIYVWVQKRKKKTAIKQK